MTAQFAPQAPQQGPPTGPQPYYQQPLFVQQQQPQRTTLRASHVLLYVFAILLPLGLIAMIFSLVTPDYSTFLTVMVWVGACAASVGGSALMCGLAVSALKNK